MYYWKKPLARLNFNYTKPANDTLRKSSLTLTVKNCTLPVILKDRRPILKQFILRAASSWNLLAHKKTCQLTRRLVKRFCQSQETCHKFLVSSQEKKSLGCALVIQNPKASFCILLMWYFYTSSEQGTVLYLTGNRDSPWWCWWWQWPGCQEDCVGLFWFCF